MSFLCQWLLLPVESLTCGLGGLDKFELLFDPRECLGLLPVSCVAESPPTVVAELVVPVMSCVKDDKDKRCIKIIF